MVKSAFKAAKSAEKFNYNVIENISLVHKFSWWCAEGPWSLSLSDFIHYRMFLTFSLSHTFSDLTLMLHALNWWHWLEKKISRLSFMKTAGRGKQIKWIKKNIKEKFYKILRILFHSNIVGVIWSRWPKDKIILYCVLYFSKIASCLVLLR